VHAAGRFGVGPQRSAAAALLLGASTVRLCACPGVGVHWRSVTQRLRCCMQLRHVSAAGCAACDPLGAVLSALQAVLGAVLSALQAVPHVTYREQCYGLCWWAMQLHMVTC
jgi:hypothetical protein